MHKIPAAEAFAEYVAAGPGRSYTSLAQRYQCSKRSIVRLARRDGWSAHLRDIEQNARARVAKNATEELAAVHERHLKTIKIVQAKALESLQHKPPTPAILKVISQCQREERELLGGGPAKPSEN